MVSQRLNFAFTIRTLIASFALGCDRTLQLRYYLSYENSAPATGRPTGEDLLSIYGQVPYLVGDDERKEFPHEIKVPRAGSYIKVYGSNSDAFEHTLDAQVVIET